ncbi:hypothetical protein CEXT_156291 [Caerostris extrusa]|uniref:Uncharacterized protein n=1 Tax=Caerostris extrusa TaxID=172846 RepID=A0AAV4QQA7_CAEEX|nr:hypothetical protein CEXT_156291 [Caerostris extrusa]
MRNIPTVKQTHLTADLWKSQHSEKKGDPNIRYHEITLLNPVQVSLTAKVFRKASLTDLVSWVMNNLKARVCVGGGGGGRT